MQGNRRFPWNNIKQLLTATGDTLSNSEIGIYRRLGGRLIYLITRPALSYYVHILSPFVSKPKPAHMKAALKPVSYLKQYPSQGVLSFGTSSLSLTAYCNVDWEAARLLDNLSHNCILGN